MFNRQALGLIKMVFFQKLGGLPNHACPVKLDVQPKSELQGLGNQNMVLGVLYSQIQ